MIGTALVEANIIKPIYKKNRRAFGWFFLFSSPLTWGDLGRNENSEKLKGTVRKLDNIEKINQRVLISPLGNVIFSSTSSWVIRIL